MAIKLKQAGETGFVILEKADRVGGTWRDNTYPGSACDVQSHLYWFSFDEQPDWTRIYPLQPEILANIDAMVARHGLAPHIRLNTEMTGAHWDDAALVWRLQLGDGNVLTADAIITAWGQLNRPSTQGIQGVDDFAGEWFHSARWNHDVQLAGRRIASIGNGPSAAQFIPELAAVAGHLDVFQRTPNYIIPRLDRAYSDEERALFLDGQARAESRNGFYLEHEGWFDAFHPGTPTAEEFRLAARTHLEDQIADPVLRERLWPSYPVGCKRLIISDDFLPALAQTERFPRKRRHRTRGSSWHTHARRRAACGGCDRVRNRFRHLAVPGHGRRGRPQRALSAPGLAGRAAGLSRHERAWFPQLLHAVRAEHQSRPQLNPADAGVPVRLCVEGVADARHRSARRWISSAGTRRFNRDLQTALRGTAWAGNCLSWYKNADNLIINNWSGSVEDYRPQPRPGWSWTTTCLWAIEAAHA